jgi:hypothetical protein
VPCSYDHNPQAARLDVAVAEVWGDPAPVRAFGWPGCVTSVRSLGDILKHDPVVIVGKVSGQVDARMGALTIWDEVLFHDGAFPGGPRCFGRLFELKPSARQYVRENMVKPGDSGACVVSRFGGACSWDGILVSGDGPQAYACFAEHILSECRQCQVFPQGLGLIV